MSALRPGVIYPYGPLLDLHHEPVGLRSATFYAFEFTGQVVKVGVSKSIRTRAKTLAGVAHKSGLTPTRFILSEPASNIRQVEKSVVHAMRLTSEPFADLSAQSGSSEWFADAQLETVRDLLDQWEVVETEEGFGRRLAIPSAALAAKAAHEQVSA